MREKLIRKREAKKLTQAQMANRCSVSERLIIGIEEEDWITHPKIVAVMAQEYGFGMRMFNQLVCESRRVDKLPKPEKPKRWNGWHAWNGNRKMGGHEDPWE